MSITSIKTALEKNSIGKFVVKLYHWCIAVPRAKILLVVYKYKRNSAVFKELSSIRFLSDEETFKQMRVEKKSLCRFGDGEIRWMFQKTTGSFGQENSKELSTRLQEIIKSTDESILIAIPKFFDEMDGYDTSRIKSRNVHLAQCASMWRNVLDLNRVYPDALITRVYNGRHNCDWNWMFEQWKSIWNNKDIIVIEGSQTRFGVGNSLLDNAATVSRIIGPSENAFSRIDDLERLAFNRPKSYLFLIALGPTATIIAYDLAKKGYQAIDVGHLDIEYEWFINSETKAVPIKGKYVNEAGGRSTTEFEASVIEKYEKQIIERVL